MIKQRTLGRTGLNVSELCLGTMNFGWKTDELRSFAILDAFREAGGNFVHAAAHCPAPVVFAASTTFSEEVVGRWWQSRAIPREQLVLATRLTVCRPPAGVPFARFVRDCVRESLRRLQTTYVDMLFFEWHRDLPPMRETMDAFDALTRRGLVRYMGAGNFPAWRVADAIARAQIHNQSRMEALQSDYSLMTRALFEPEVISLCQERRLGFIARSPIAGGFLARGRWAPDLTSFSRSNWLDRRFDNAYGEAGLAAVSDVAARHEASSAQIALSWVLHNPTVTSAMIGVHSPAQLNELVGSSRIKLSDVDLAQLADATAKEEVQIAANYSVTVPATGELVRS